MHEMSATENLCILKQTKKHYTQWKTLEFYDYYSYVGSPWGMKSFK